MIGIREIQFAGILLMTVLTILLSSIRIPISEETKPYRMSRGFMLLSVVLLLIQFLLQRILDLRSEDGSAAVFINLMLFIPANGAFNIGYLYLQRRGRLKPLEFVAWPVEYVVTMVTLVSALIIDKGNFAGPVTQASEIVIAGIFFLSMATFDCLSIREFFITKRKLDNYYDTPVSYSIAWAFLSMVLLFVTSLTVPFCLFFGNRLFMIVLSIVFFVIYSFSMIHFTLYYFDRKIVHVALAEEPETENPQLRKRNNKFSEEEKSKISEALDRWVSQKKYVTAGITIDNLAADLGLQRTTISQYLNDIVGKTFRDWLTDLRIEEAYLQLAAHPEYSNAYIAEACGFSSRQYFQNVFHLKTGKTPLAWIKENVKENI